MVGFNVTSVLPQNFQPNWSSTCVLWLRADLGITLNGSNVSQWADKSSAGNTVSQGTAVSQPPWASSGGPNNLAALGPFNGTSHYMFAATAPVSNNPFTIFLVHKFSSASSSSGVSYSIGGNSNGGSFGNLGSSLRFLSWNGVSTVSDSTSNATTNWEVWTITSSPTPSQTLRVNGTAQTLSSSTVSINSTNENVVGGRNRLSLNDLLTGSVAEIIAFNIVLNSNQIMEVESYIRARTQIW